MTLVNRDVTQTSVVSVASGPLCIQPIEGETVDQRDGVLRTADRLFFSPFGDAHPGRRPDAPRWEPDFCVLPGDAAPARKAPDPETEPVDGGSW